MRTGQPEVRWSLARVHAPAQMRRPSRDTARAASTLPEFAPIGLQTAPVAAGASWSRSDAERTQARRKMSLAFSSSHGPRERHVGSVPGRGQGRGRGVGGTPLTGPRTRTAHGGTPPRGTHGTRPDAKQGVVTGCAACHPAVGRASRAGVPFDPTTAGVMTSEQQTQRGPKELECTARAVLLLRRHPVGPGMLWAGRTRRQLPQERPGTSSRFLSFPPPRCYGGRRDPGHATRRLTSPHSRQNEPSLPGAYRGRPQLVDCGDASEASRSRPPCGEGLASAAGSWLSFPPAAVGWEP